MPVVELPEGNNVGAVMVGGPYDGYEHAPTRLPPVIFVAGCPYARTLEWKAGMRVYVLGVEPSAA